MPDRDGARRAGGDHARAGPGQIEVTRNRIDGGVRKVMVDPGRTAGIDALGEHREVVLLVAQQIARPRPQQHADARAVDAALEQARLRERLASGHDAELLAARPAAPLPRGEARLHVEEIHLARDAAAERRRVEQRHAPKPGQSGDHVLPVGFASDAERRNEADSCDGDARHLVGLRTADYRVRAADEAALS